MRVRGFKVGIDDEKSRKRFGPFDRSRKISAVHLLPMIFMALAMHPVRFSRLVCSGMTFILYFV